jgi:pimeloyl-ACP methyl ester carboxylesterase
MTRRLRFPDGSSLAYRKSPGGPPTVVWLGGFTSDMTGTKATALEAYCRERGFGCVRFDYQGHGASSGRFRDGTIGRWVSDAVAVVDRLTEGPAVLVGSSMGGWLMVLAALARPDRVTGLVGIASAPDFTEELLWPCLGEAGQRELMDREMVPIPNPYGPEPTVVTRRLIEEGREHLVLRRPIPVTCPARLLHGLEDAEVPWETSVRLAQALQGRDVVVSLLKGADHRCSDPRSLERIFRAVDEVCELARGAGEP